MNGILVVLILLGLLLTVGGALVMFTDRGLEWMYKQGIWSLKGEAVHDKARRRVDKYIRGAGILVCGLIMFGGSLLAFLSQWEFMRIAILEFFTF
jgi:hypothetical protein